jgi:hypothetical protein
MNRAWIPVGALAGVSVAGLIALGPLTSSMGTPVSFPTSIPTLQPGASAPVIRVNANVGVKGHTTVNAGFKVKRTPGGRANGAVNPTNITAGNVGEVATKITPRTGTTAPATAQTHVTVSTPPAKPKKPAKRPVSITASGETNGDGGFASGGGNQQTSNGAQSQTPSSGN